MQLYMHQSLQAARVGNVLKGGAEEARALDMFPTVVACVQVRTDQTKT